MTGLYRRRGPGESGFTLVETLAALTVFSIITLGVVPLLGNSMRALGVSRNRTVAENVVRASVERLQGIRYYVSWDAKAKKVDLLDYYLPQTAGTFAPGQSYGTSVSNPPLVAPASGGTGVFTTVCPPPAGTNQACPSDIPAGYTLRFTASFVEPVANTNPQTYRVVNPTPSYSATPTVTGTCQASPCSDRPPADLIDLKVTGSWNYGGAGRAFAVRSMVGDRTFSSGVVTNAVPPSPGATPAPSSAPNPSAPVRMRGNATIDYQLRGETGFALTSGSFPSACGTEPCNHSEMLFTIGQSDARVETKDTSTADVNTRFGEARIVRTYPVGTTPPPSPPPDLNYVTGATSILHAPPTDFRTVDDARTAILDVANPDQPMALQGRIYPHENYGMKVDVSNELPQAEGGFRTPTGATGDLEWYINNTQRDPSSTGPMHLDTGYPIFMGMKYATTTGSSSTNGTTKVNTGALGTPDRRVQSTASFRLPWMYVFPRIYAGRNGADSFMMMSFYDFVANVNCKATANAATAIATGSWSFSFQYYYDATNNGRQANSLGSGTVNSSGSDVLNGVAVPDALEALQAQNPLIYDAAPTNGCCSNTSDMYMFDVRTGNTATSYRGYISDWSTNKTVDTKVSSDGRSTSASINGAVRLESADLRQTITPELPQSAISLSIGKLSCNAVDNR